MTTIGAVTRRTKIIATIGPSSSDEATLRNMIRAGMDVARLNMSHGSVEDGLERFHRIRALAAEAGRPVGILADLPGPKVRIGSIESPQELDAGDELLLSPGEGASTNGRLMVNYESLLSDVRVGDQLAIGDGSIVLEVLDTEADALRAKVLYGGSIQGRPGLHIPSDRLRISTPTPADLRILDAFVSVGVDMVAVSFVRSAHDIRRVGLEPAPRGPLVIAKIETRAAVENLDGIISAAGAVMVARGDLGTELSIEELPHLQKEIISRCIALGRPAITATQMLESMISAPSPTRAEASDVANAVFDGTSAVMLSGETAIGHDPARVVSTMARIAERADQQFDHDGWAHQIRRDRLSEPEGVDAAVTDVMSMATWRAAAEMGIRTIICVSRSGFTVRAISRFRPAAQIIGFSPDERTVRQLTLSWGATPILIDKIGDNNEQVANALETAKSLGHIHSGEVVAILGGSTATVGSTDTLRMSRCP